MRVLGVSWPFAYGLVSGFYPVEQSRNRRLIATKRLPEWVFVYCCKGPCKQLEQHIHTTLSRTSVTVPTTTAAVVGAVMFEEVDAAWVRRKYPQFPLWDGAAQLLHARERVAFPSPVPASYIAPDGLGRFDRWLTIPTSARSTLCLILRSVVIN